jgi:transposase-like protein
MSVLSSPHFHDEAKAFEFLEGVVWADGVTCPHCGVVGGRVYDLSGVRSKPSAKNPEGVVRHGLKKCGECRKQFTVKVGTVFEHARMPLHKMLQAVHLMVSSKKGISSHQLSRVLEVQYKSAWFLAHRIREAMRDGNLAPFGTTGGRVEVDETYIGRKAGEAGIKEPRRSGSSHKNRVVTLVDRDTGAARSMPANGLVKDEVARIVRANVAKEAKLTTDESRLYAAVGKEFASHDFVTHGRSEYVRGDVTTNTVEGFFSIFKRGMRGVYQHCGEQHLHRYLAEFDFRYTNRTATGCDDRARGNRALAGIVGKRLTYKGPNGIDAA